MMFSLINEPEKQQHGGTFNKTQSISPKDITDVTNVLTQLLTHL